MTGINLYYQCSNLVCVYEYEIDQKLFKKFGFTASEVRILYG